MTQATDVRSTPYSGSQYVNREMTVACALNKIGANATLFASDRTPYVGVQKP